MCTHQAAAPESSASSPHDAESARISSRAEPTLSQCDPSASRSGTHVSRVNRYAADEQTSECDSYVRRSIQMIGRTSSTVNCPMVTEYRRHHHKRFFFIG